ncbi:MAG: hypothetical protein KNU04_gp05 [crAssphage sp. isolate ctbg_1]|uniref:Plasmid replication protein RepL domain-containing protein n=1 Tax=crAssphage sp. isolate ctbg_1 TaxID=2989854 RepID=A0A345MSY4_9CAUD|nr:MAG: hypothetical protein KNU04_gp05 [crAssphage sp. isolate ctbg_1]AXH74484.1 MAG: hypothetical protein [crAssphage sp. isolate ctbg_1]
MARRGIKTAKGAIEARVAYDKDFFIRATKFPIKSKIVKVEGSVLDYDPSDGMDVVKMTSSNFMTYDKRDFVSVNRTLFKYINKLSPKGFALFEYIIDNIPRHANHIKLNTDIILSVIKSKHQPDASKALNELINIGIIGKSTDIECKQTYTINHNLYFNGNYNRFIFNYNKIYGKSNDIKNADD